MDMQEPAPYEGFDLETILLWRAAADERGTTVYRLVSDAMEQFLGIASPEPSANA